ncbi:TGS domain-containing protein, partial [Paenibacillus sepulcri]|nr:TGS domain-containing protein [Paenibacillus sepulcri]
MAMKRVQVRMQDGKIREVEQGTTALQVAEAISASLRKSAACARVDGRLVDLDTALVEDCALEIVTLASEDGLAVYRHSTAHLMAQAIRRLYGQEAV